MRALVVMLSGLFLWSLAAPVAALTPLRSPAQKADDARQREQASAILRGSIGRCFSAPREAAGRSVTVIVQLNTDGSIVGAPAAARHAADPGTKALAAAAMRAIRRCAPYAMPDELRAKPFLWSRQTLRFTSER
jgi:colicin import membrane protein